MKVITVDFFRESEQSILFKMTNLWDELDTMQIQIGKDSYECQICDKDFTSPIQLTVHCIVLHGLVPCTHCLKLFENVDVLDQHTRTQHACENHICAECSNKFPNQNDLASHITFKHAMRLCELCGLLNPIDDYPQHLSTLHKVTDNLIQIPLNPVNQNEYRCHLCHDKKSVDRLDKLLLHYLYFHKCSLQSLLLHILNGNDMNSLQSRNMDDDVHTKCSACSLSYTWSMPKIYHKIYCQHFIYCMACTKCFNTQENYDKHMERCDKKPSKIWFCNNCCHPTIDELHFQTVHNISTASWSQETSLLNTKNECNFCAENLNSKAANLNQIIDHFRTLHNFKATAILSYLKPGKIEIKTEKIEKQWLKRARENVAEFKAIDEDENVEYQMHFDTKLVNYVYSSESDYDSSGSDDNVARTYQTYQCDLCDYKSRSKFVYVMHMHKKHGFSVKTPEFRCNVCRKIFTSNNTLRKHNQNFHHKQIEGNRFKCTFCEFGCNGKTKIR